MREGGSGLGWIPDPSKLRPCLTLSLRNVHAKIGRITNLFPLDKNRQLASLPLRNLQLVEYCFTRPVCSPMILAKKKKRYTHMA